MKPLTESELRAWVKDYMRSGGLSLRALASVAGADKSALSRFLNGKQPGKLLLRRLGFSMRFVRI